MLNRGLREPASGAAAGSVQRASGAGLAATAFSGVLPASGTAYADGPCPITARNCAITPPELGGDVSSRLLCPSCHSVLSRSTRSFAFQSGYALHHRTPPRGRLIAIRNPSPLATIERLDRVPVARRWMVKVPHQMSCSTVANVLDALTPAQESAQRPPVDGESFSPGNTLGREVGCGDPTQAAAGSRGDAEF